MSEPRPDPTVIPESPSDVQESVVSFAAKALDRCLRKDDDCAVFERVSDDPANPCVIPESRSDVRAPVPLPRDEADVSHCNSESRLFIFAPPSPQPSPASGRGGFDTDPPLAQGAKWVNASLPSARRGRRIQ